MKSSSIRRSALSRESMDVIENLANQDNTSYQLYEDTDNTPGIYLREETHSSGKSNISDSKAKEIDMLWQSFKSSQFNTNSPLICYLGGILTGIVLSVAIMFLFGVFKTNDIQNTTNETNTQSIEETINSAKEIINEEKVILPASTENENDTFTQNNKEDVVSTNVKMVKYTIKDGDTVEAIIKKHYGSYSPEKAEAIMKANNLKNLDRISIDQVLLIPMEK